MMTTMATTMTTSMMTTMTMLTTTMTANTTTMIMITTTIANGADAMQRALNAGAVVGTEASDALNDSIQIVATQRSGSDRYGTPRVTRFRDATEIEHHLQ